MGIYKKKPNQKRRWTHESFNLAPPPSGCYRKHTPSLFLYICILFLLEFREISYIAASEILRISRRKLNNIFPCISFLMSLFLTKQTSFIEFVYSDLLSLSPSLLLSHFSWSLSVRSFHTISHSMKTRLFHRDT